MASQAATSGFKRKTITAFEGADLLGITPRHFRRLAAAGKLAVEPPAYARARRDKKETPEFQMMTSVSNVVGFIRENKAWSFHPTRDKTRRACVEVLSRIPPSVRDLIIKSKRLLVIAPGVGMVGQVNPYVFDLMPGESTPRFQVIVLCAELEKASSKMLVAFVVKCVAAAIQPVLPSGEMGKVSLEKLACLWGFKAEMDTIDRSVKTPKMSVH